MHHPKGGGSKRNAPPTERRRENATTTQRKCSKEEVEKQHTQRMKVEGTTTRRKTEESTPTLFWLVVASSSTKKRYFLTQVMLPSSCSSGWYCRAPLLWAVELLLLQKETKLSYLHNVEQMDIFFPAETYCSGNLGTSWQEASIQNNEAPALQIIPNVTFSWAGQKGWIVVRNHGMWPSHQRSHKGVTKFSGQSTLDCITCFAVSCAGARANKVDTMASAAKFFGFTSKT